MTGRVESSDAVRTVGHVAGVGAGAALQEQLDAVAAAGANGLDQRRRHRRQRLRRRVQTRARVQARAHRRQIAAPHRLQQALQRGAASGSVPDPPHRPCVHLFAPHSCSGHSRAWTRPAHSSASQRHALLLRTAFQ